MPDRTNNLVTFLPVGGSEHIVLQLAGDWCVSGGMECNVNTATIRYTERAKLPTNLVYVSGSVFFWGDVVPGEGDPYHVLANQWLVGCDVELRGREPGDSTDGLKAYKLSFADHRYAFLQPRGGRLCQGLGNPDPLGDATLRVNSELIAACLAALGISAGVPGSVDAVDAPRQLEWFNAHAGDELGRLLQTCGHVYCPYSAGGASVQKLGVGTMPTLDAARVSSDVTSSSVNRLPTTAVFTSGNEAVARTFDDTGSDLPQWEFVAQDPDDDYAYKALGEIAALGGSPDVELAKGLPSVADRDRKLFLDQLYKIIRLKSDRFDAVQSPVLRDVLYPDGRVDQPHLVATVAVQGVDGAWINRQTRLNAQTVDGIGNLLSFDQRIGKVKGGDERADLDPFFEPLPGADLKPTFTVEDWDGDADAKKYSVFGFVVGLLGVGAISEASARAQLTGYRPATGVYDAPELREIYLNDNTSNRDVLGSSAEKMATALLLDFPNSRVVEVKGFVPVQIDGRINEVRYSQSGLRTTIIRDGWTSTNQGRHGHHPHPARGGGGGFARHGSDNPLQQTSRSPDTARRRALPGQVRRGGTQARTPAAPLSKTPPHPTGSRRVGFLASAAVAGRINWYNGTTYSGRFKRDASGDFASTDVGQVSATVDCVICSSAPLPLHQLMFGDAGPTTDDGKLMIFAQPAQVFVVKVNKDGGAIGAKTAPATWTYTVKDLGDRTLATALSPQRARPLGRRNFAPDGTYGLATYVSSSVVLLDVYGEGNTTGGCT